MIRRATSISRYVMIAGFSALGLSGCHERTTMLQVDSAGVYPDGGSIEVRARDDRGATVIFRADNSLDRDSTKGILAIQVGQKSIDTAGSEAGMLLADLASWLDRELKEASKSMPPSSPSHSTALPNGTDTKAELVRGLFQLICADPKGVRVEVGVCDKYKVRSTPDGAPRGSNAGN
jgi:hypothetical protein